MRSLVVRRGALELVVVVQYRRATQLPVLLFTQHVGRLETKDQRRIGAGPQFIVFICSYTGEDLIRRVLR